MTAVEWFAMITGGWRYASKAQLEKAKEMEKEQKKFFFECGRNFQLTGEGTFEEVCNETYKSD